MLEPIQDILYYCYLFIFKCLNFCRRQILHSRLFIYMRGISSQTVYSVSSFSSFTVLNMEALFDSVKSSIGLDVELKTEQKKVMEDLLMKKNVFVVWPTGFGKSMLFVLTPLLFDQVCWRLVIVSNFVYVTVLVCFWRPSRLIDYSSITAQAGIGYHFGVPRNILPVVK